MTKEEAAILLMLAIANFPTLQDKNFTPTRTLWELMLADLSFETAKKALLKVLLTARFFPTVGEIREAAAGFRRDSIPEAEIAWQEVLEQLNPYKTPNWSSELIAGTVRTIGYRRMCESENISVERAHFFKVYEVLKSRQQRRCQNRVVLSLCQKMPQVPLVMKEGVSRC